MGIWEIFSKKRKRERGEFSPEVYIYKEIPDKLRNQLIMIWEECLEASCEALRRKFFEDIKKVLCREYGKFKLVETRSRSVKDEVFSWFLSEKNAEHCLDAIQLACEFIEKYSKDKEVIEEINIRFQEAGVGYQYVNHKIVRMDSQYLHKESVISCLELLNDEKFSGANKEFLKAHEHYRQGKFSDCLTECAKAFESTMKIICDEKGWVYQKDKGTSRNLIEVLFENKLLPDFLISKFTSLRSMLESGIPTMRNRRSAHGQGGEDHKVPEYLAAYQLHVTASTILMLVRAYNES